MSITLFANVLAAAYSAALPVAAPLLGGGDPVACRVRQVLSDRVTATGVVGLSAQVRSDDAQSRAIRIMHVWVGFEQDGKAAKTIVSEMPIIDAASTEAVRTTEIARRERNAADQVLPTRFRIVIRPADGAKWGDVNVPGQLIVNVESQWD